MKFIFPLFLFILFTTPVKAQNINILPEEKLYHSHFADALSHQFSLSKHLESSQWFGNVGAEIPVIKFEYMKHQLQVSAAGTVFNTVIKTPGHIQVYTVDYLVDFFFDYNLSKNLPLRFTFGHLSAHYSDDGITELSSYPISYVRDYLGLYFQYRLEVYKIYAGYVYNFHIEPEINNKNTFQFGGDRFFVISSGFSFYTAVDFKLKEEVNFNPTQSYQTGFEITGYGARALRFSYTFRNGFEERGQLYNIRSRKHSIGVYLDI
jgi:hypothetical protein